MSLIPALVLLSWAQHTDGLPPIDFEKDFVVTKTKVYGLIHPVTVIADSVSRKISLSKTGRYVVVVQEDQRAVSENVELLVKPSKKSPKVPPTKILLYDIHLRAAKTLFTTAESVPADVNIDWVSDDSGLILSITRTNPSSQELVLQDIRYIELPSLPGSRVSMKYLVSAKDDVGIYVHPSQPYFVLCRVQELQASPQTLIQVFQKGNLQATITQPLRLFPVGIPYGNGRFTDFITLDLRAEGEAPRRPQKHFLDFATMKLLPSLPPQVTSDKHRTPDLPVTFEGGETAFSPQGSSLLKQNSSCRLYSKDSKEPQAVLSEECSEAYISPALDHIVYISKGVAFVQRISEVDKALYEKGRIAQLKTRLLMQAKSLGLAFHMHCADNDDVGLGPKGWQDKLLPYIMDRQSMEGFHFTFAGGPLTNVEDPNKTELGYFEGPGGRAVVYIDGHAKWIPNP